MGSESQSAQHLLLVPSLACPASCGYCFGPHQGKARMSLETVEAVVRWQSSQGNDRPLDITFHGGEPLVAGAEFYRAALPLLRQGLAPRRVRFSMQSNLWLLTPELCSIFREHGVALGTSLDGPETINDAQRGRGYFKRTMEHIDLARKHGLNIGCICTFTAQSAPKAGEVFDFFVREGLSFTMHAAAPSLRYPGANPWVLSPEAYGALMVEMLDRYLPNLEKIRIDTLDFLCRSVSERHGKVCTFGDCLGGYLAVGPDGDIYPCQRFCGMQEYGMGSLQDASSQQALAASPVWHLLEDRERRITEECSGCHYLDLCRGGCPYNALAANGSYFEHTLRDPYCTAYQRIFDHIVDRAADDVFSSENMAAVVERVEPEQGLLRHGRLLSLMRGAPHPHETAQHARRVLAAVALAATGSPSDSTLRFEQLGLVSNLVQTELGMEALHKRLTTPARSLGNLYLHVTFACPLHCTHCYAQAGSGHNGAMPVDALEKACEQASELRFRHAVITGGEPLVHPQRDELFGALAELRQAIKPMLTVLRTSLTLPVDEALLRRIAHSTDEVVVSVDGDRETHDARRGAGSYDRMLDNLRALVEMGYDTDLSLACVLPLKQVHGAAGDSVRALAAELGIRRTRFRPVLPLGRASGFEPDSLPEALLGHMQPRDLVAYGFEPVTSCGMGHNLYVEPDGSAYPCYAWHGENWRLGTIQGPGGLPGVIDSAAYRDLGEHTVNSNRRCQMCSLRYLCGGACRAWNRQPDSLQTDLDASPVDCSTLHRRARSILLSALEYLGISEAQWLAAGLPLPDSPPAI
jgi:uncharacterized protein